MIGWEQGGFLCFLLYLKHPTVHVFVTHLKKKSPHRDGLMHDVFTDWENIVFLSVNCLVLITSGFCRTSFIFDVFQPTHRCINHQNSKSQNALQQPVKHRNPFCVKPDLLSKTFLFFITCYQRPSHLCAYVSMPPC